MSDTEDEYFGDTTTDEETEDEAEVEQKRLTEKARIEALKKKANEVVAKRKADRETISEGALRSVAGLTDRYYELVRPEPSPYGTDPIDYTKYEPDDSFIEELDRKEAEVQAKQKEDTRSEAQREFDEEEEAVRKMFEAEDEGEDDDGWGDFDPTFTKDPTPSQLVSRESSEESLEDVADSEFVVEGNLDEKGTAFTFSKEFRERVGAMPQEEVDRRTKVERVDIEKLRQKIFSKQDRVDAKDAKLFETFTGGAKGDVKPPPTNMGAIIGRQLVIDKERATPEFLKRINPYLATEKDDIKEEKAIEGQR